MRFALPALVVLLTACEARPTAEWEVRDSAGIRVVLNHQDADELSPPVSLADTPSLVIGTAEGAGETDFYRIADVAQIGEALIAIADGDSNQVRLFNLEGDFVRLVGREGDGPGEFRAVRRIGQFGDTLWVFDSALRRLTLFDGRDDVVATREVGFFPIGSRDRSLGDVRLTRDGEIVGTDWSHMSQGTSPSISIDTAYWAVVRPDGSNSVITELEGARTAHYEMGTRRLFRLLPLTNIPSWDFSEEQLYLTSGALHEIRVVGLDRVMRQIIRRSASTREVDHELAERWKDSVRSRAERLGQTNGLEEFLAAVPIADTVAAYDEIHVDATGLIWALSSGWEGVRSNPPWDLFNSDGRFVGSVELPVPLRVQEIGEDYLLGVWRDQFEVEFVHRYALER